MTFLERYCKLLYAGYVIVRQHTSSYLGTAISSSLWFLVIMIPAVHYSDQPELLVALYTPAYLALFVASMGSSTSVEFLRWLAYEGLTDVYREAGLGTFHYTVSTWPFDLLTAFVSFSLLASVLGERSGLGPLWFATNINLTGLPLFLIAAFSVEVFFGGLTALIYTHTRLSASFQGLIQMVLSISAFVPLWRLPTPVIGLLNPAVYLAEVARFLYGVSIIEEQILLALSPFLVTVYFLAGHAMFKSSDKVLAMYGLEFRV